MATQRTSFTKLQRDRAKKAKAAAKPRAPAGTIRRGPHRL